MSIQDLTVRQLIEQTSSSEPMPGGGAVAAITGSLGLSLVIMALQVTLKRGESAELSGLLSEAQELLADMENCADNDIASYNQYVAARGDEQAVQNALIQCTEVPLQTAKLMKQGIELAERASGLITGSIAADVKTGRELLETSLRATLHNVEVNCKYIKDEELKAKYLEQSNNLQ